MAAFNTPFNTQPKKANKKELFITLGVVGALVIGTLGYYLWPKSGQQDQGGETPPSITITSSKFKGMLKGDDICPIDSMYKFSDTEISSYVLPPGASGKEDPNWNILKQGIGIYHSNSDITAKKIIDSIIPTEGNKILLMYYPSSDENTEKKFSAYPSLVGNNSISTPSEFTIPAHEGFLIFSCKDTKIWGIKDEKKLGSGVSPKMANKKSGWVLLSAEENKSLADTLKPFKNKVKSVWVQNAPFEDSGFVISWSANPAYIDNLKTNHPSWDYSQVVTKFEDIKTVGDYKMVWLKVGPEQGAGPDSIPNVVATNIIDMTATTMSPDVAADILTLNITPDKDVAITKIEAKVIALGTGSINDLKELVLYFDGKSQNTLPLANSTGEGNFAFDKMEGGGLVIPKGMSKALNLKLKTTTTPKDGGKYKVEISKIEFSSPVNFLPAFPITGIEKEVKIAAKLGKPIDFVVNGETQLNKKASVTLKWSPPAGIKPSADMKKYILRYGTGTIAGEKKLKEIDVLAGDTSAQVQDLALASDYWFSLAAVDTKGVEGEAANVFRMTQGLINDPIATCNSTCYTACVQSPAAETYQCPMLPAIQGLQVSQKNSTSIEIAWTAPAVDPKFIKTYNVEYSTPNVNLGNSPETSRMINSLTPSTQYYFTVSAIDNNDKKGMSSTISATTGAQGPSPAAIPSAPTKPTFNYTYTHSTYLYWSQPNPDLDTLKGKYRISYKKDGCASKEQWKTKIVLAWDAANKPYGYKAVLANTTSDDILINTKYGVTISASNDGITWSPESECAEFKTTAK